MKTILIIFFTLLFIGASGKLQAAGELEFRQGISLYKKGNYSTALKKFESAKLAGMDEPRLDYNLALCHLKLKRYEQARNHFLEAGQHKPLDGLISFNLGLLELERGNRDEAIRWFTHVRDTAEPKLRALARQRLALLADASGSTGGVIWDKGYRLYVGYDDNIEDPAQVGTTNKGDSFTSAMAYASRIQGGANGTRFGLIGFLQHYSAVNIYDLDLVQLSLDKGFVTGEWRNRVGAEVEHTSLGGNSYLQTGKLQLSGKLSTSTTDTLRLRYRFSDITALSQNYEYLAGKRHELELRWQRELPQLELQVGYEFEVNNRNDFRGATTFSSYSPTRHTLDLRIEKPLEKRWKLDGRFNWRSSSYSDENILSGGSHVTRSDSRMITSLGISRALSGSMDVGFEYKFTENNSNIATYDYSRNIYALGISGSF